jgi:hypothetical protein
MSCLHPRAPTRNSRNNFPHFWHLIPSPVLADWLHLIPQTPQGTFQPSSTPFALFQVRTEIVHLKKRAPLRLVLISTVWSIWSPFLKTIPDIVLYREMTGTLLLPILLSFIIDRLYWRYNVFCKWKQLRMVDWEFRKFHQWLDQRRKQLMAENYARNNIRILRKSTKEI